MQKYSYLIKFNKGKIEQQFSYKYAKKTNCEIGIGDGCATISYMLSKLENAKYLIEFESKCFYDAYRKVLLLYALNYNRGLKVESIEIIINDKIEVFTNNDSNFPFMFSIINEEYLNLNASWKTISKKVIEFTKTNSKEDLRFSAMYAYLMSKSREYEIDKFENLWTAMNAYYSYFAKCYENSLIEELNGKTLNSNQKAFGNEMKSIGILSWYIDPHYTNIKDKNLLENIWNKDYSIENSLKNITDEQIKLLYDNAIECGYDGKVKEAFVPIQNKAKEFETALFPFLLLSYPYHYRCKYVHGNVIQPLIIAYNESEMYVLKTINYFLDRYLDTEIPKMFDEKFWNDNKYNAAKQFLEFFLKCK